MVCLQAQRCTSPKGDRCCKSFQNVTIDLRLTRISTSSIKARWEKGLKRFCVKQQLRKLWAKSFCAKTPWGTCLKWMAWFLRIGIGRAIWYILTKFSSVFFRYMKTFVLPRHLEINMENEIDVQVEGLSLQLEELRRMTALRISKKANVWTKAIEPIGVQNIDKQKHVALFPPVEKHSKTILNESCPRRQSIVSAALQNILGIFIS